MDERHHAHPRAQRGSYEDFVDELFRLGLTREDACALASIAVDFAVIQVVDGVQGIHAMITKRIFV